MKVRNGFVSNSSASSFVLDKKNLTKLQLLMINDHIAFGKYLNFLYRKAPRHIPRMMGEFYADDYDKWKLTDLGDKIYGSTWMDNFDISEFFLIIGVSEDDFLVAEADSMQYWKDKGYL